MDNKKIKAALQDLVYRLQDAEKGYQEIEKATSNPTLSNWLKDYSQERHQMHKELESLIAALGFDATVDTTFLGSIHRLFIDLKINHVSQENEYDAVVDEIERGSSVLLKDYKKVLSDVTMPANYIITLKRQMATIEAEVESLVKLKEELNSIPA